MLLKVGGGGGKRRVSRGNTLSWGSKVVARKKRGAFVPNRPPSCHVLEITNKVYSLNMIST